MVSYLYLPRVCARLSQGNTDQDVFLGQRASDIGGQQVRYGTRTCDIVRTGQNAGRRTEHRVLRDVRQRQPQCQGQCSTPVIIIY